MVYAAIPADVELVATEVRSSMGGANHSYLKTTGLRLGLLLNFNGHTMKKE